MSEYDRAIELCPARQITLNRDNLTSAIIVYDLETAGFKREDDILQVHRILCYFLAVFFVSWLACFLMSPVGQIYVAISNAVLFKLYFQIAAIIYDPSIKACLGQFCEYVEPTGPIPVAASKVNGLFFFGDRLCKKTDGGMVPLPAIPARLALDKFAKWLLDIQDDTEPKQVICLGYNNSSFDDHFLMAHWKKKLEPETFCLLLICRKYSARREN